MGKRSRSISYRSDLFTLHFLPTIIVFFTITVLVGFSWRTATRAVYDSEIDQVNVRANYIETNIMQQLAMNDHILRAGAGLFKSSNDVTRAEWKDFVETVDIANELPAMLGLGYVQLVPADQVAGFEAFARSEGLASFTIFPADPARPLYSSIKYIEPMNERNQAILGGDMLTEVNRREAMERARDSGKTSITNVVDMRQENETRQNGITMYFPVYRQGAPTSTVEERRSAITGYVYSPLKSELLFGDIFDKNDKNFNFQIFDGTELKPETMLYQQQSNIQGEPYRLIQSGTIVNGYQTWIIQYSVRDGIVASSMRERPNSLAVGGTIFAVMVAGFVYMLLQRRTKLIAHKEEQNIQRAKDDLLSLASHQLRTPATGVKQYLGMVLEGFTGDITAEQKTMLTNAYESNERQLRIINEFLYMAKADADRIVLSPQKFDLIKLTRQTLTDMQSEIDDREHTVKIKCRAKTLTATADVYSARMIIENLISNAVKYTPNRGKITIEIKKSNQYATVSVSDNGVGIKKADFHLLFKQFSRIPNKLTRQTSGSGIGLYLAKHLAKLNGGAISVKSEKDVGSTFTVSFPYGNVKNVTVNKPKKKLS